MSPKSQQNESFVAADFSGQQVLVLGLGLTGLSVVRYLYTKGAQIRVMDSRAQPPGAAELRNSYGDIESVFGQFDEGLLQQVDLLVLSPGIDPREAIVKRARSLNIEVIGDVELFLRHNRMPIIAITGSNGKSTVTTLVGALCRAQGLKTLVAGNIGEPVLTAAENALGYDLAVLELSSFQLELCENLAARAATILNISEDHLDRYDSLECYIDAKARILRDCQSIVLPKEDPYLKHLPETDDATHFSYSPASDSSDYGVQVIDGKPCLCRGKEAIINEDELAILGEHNICNVLAALALIEFLSLDATIVQRILVEFTGLAHRMQTVAVHDGVTWINDSKATNVGAALAAIASLKKKIVWIGGGQSKGADLKPLRRPLARYCVLAVLLGEDAHLIEEQISSEVCCQRVDNMHAAVRTAKLHLHEAEVVLLSPACASLDMYENFEHRGDDFAEEVNAQVIGAVA